MGKFSEKNLAKLIRRTLLAGVCACLLLFLCGFAARFLGDARADRMFAAGIAVLLMTPAARVAMLVYGYWRAGESAFALAALAVLALLSASVLL